MHFFIKISTKTPFLVETKLEIVIRDTKLWRTDDFRHVNVFNGFGGFGFKVFGLKDGNCREGRNGNLAI